MQLESFYCILIYNLIAGYSFLLISVVKYAVHSLDQKYSRLFTEVVAFLAYCNSKSSI